MKAFNRGIKKPGFLDALKQLSGQPGWWQDVLLDNGLIIAIRDDYLNVYWQGQSIFKVEFDGNRVRPTTHPKYLVDPDLKARVPLVGSTFAIGPLTERGFVAEYKGNKTLGKMKRAAAIYAGGEKEGVHRIVTNSSSVIDVEIAFSSGLENEKGAKLPRIDVATLEDREGIASLAFWEAKLYLNPELRARGEGSPPVLKQIDTYKAELRAQRPNVEKSYRCVASNLVSIAEMSQGARSAGGLVAKVAAGGALALGDEPAVGLLIFGFDSAQRDDTEIWGSHLKKLTDALPERVKPAGDPKHIRL